MILALLALPALVVAADYDPSRFSFFCSAYEKNGHRYMTEYDTVNGRGEFIEIAAIIKDKKTIFGSVQQGTANFYFKGDTETRSGNAYFLLHGDHYNIVRKIANAKSQMCATVLKYGDNIIGLIKRGAKKQKFVGTLDSSTDTFYYLDHVEQKKEDLKVFDDIAAGKLHEDSFEVLCYEEHNYA
ncbi:unnamed protein product [Caenorhabditis auriculariae]|uniref:Uncharacterized protein n=1 Tax=Caenorhabditis auriculariae TaxID=2777116 RepID=A0A8S1HQ01_9PELO|nr:unnamed protein product [Caenorhabditis auriculariae]